MRKAPTKGKLQQESIFVRPPKGFSGPTKTFNLTVVEPGKFDVENSFIDESKPASLHVLARHKKPKAPTKKGVAAAPEVPRGDFTNDVIELVKAAYGIEELAPSKFKSVSKKHAGRENSYKETKLNLNAKEVLVYLYGDKNGPYNVALIFEYPKSEAKNLSSKINLSLEAFAVGDARRSSVLRWQPRRGGGQEGGGGRDAGPVVPI